MNKLTTIFLLITTLLAGCLSQEMMTLLDQEVNAVSISRSEGLGGINENTFHTFTDDESIAFFEQAITTAQVSNLKSRDRQPDYDILIEYKPTDEGGFPTHGLHLWLGQEDEKSKWSYIGDDTIYISSEKVTNQLRKYILSVE